MTAISSMNMASALVGLTQPIILYRKKGVQNVDGKPISDFEELSIEATVQPASKSILTSATVDTSKRYLWVHSSNEIKMGDEMDYEGVRFKTWQVGPFKDYGYAEVIFEEMK